MTASVLAATSLHKSKAYCVPILGYVFPALQGVADRYMAFDTPVPCLGPPGGEDCIHQGLGEYAGPESVYARCARVREITRRFFLECGNWTHLYFHDCDMIPPADVIPRLLALDAPIASALYVERASESVLPLPTDVGDATGTLLASLQAEQVVDGKICAPAFGMGCMLLRRDVLERTAFRPLSYWDSPGKVAGEDYLFCFDSGLPVLVDTSLSCWHVDTGGTAQRVTIGEAREGLVYTGRTKYVLHPLYGYFSRYEPRYDVPEAGIRDLTFHEGYQYRRGRFLEKTREERHWKEVLA